MLTGVSGERLDIDKCLPLILKFGVADKEASLKFKAKLAIGDRQTELSSIPITIFFVPLCDIVILF